MTTSTPAGQVRVRIAPSPTGDPHVGTAYAALFNLAFARRNGGRFILRIEDTDRSRFTPGSEAQIFHTLHWLGLEWDEGPDIGGPVGPYRQSERLATYGSFTDELLASGHAYLCWCTTDRLAELRREQVRTHQTQGYDRLCLGKTEAERAMLPGFTDKPVVRMLVPPDIELAFDDLIRGRVSSPLPDDQVLRKSDGFPTYHLAAVVDDHLMGISHVIRGEEWISSTAKQRQLYHWLGWEAPQYAHFPLLRNADKSKISKRKDPAARLLWFEESGFLPEAVINFLALLGYSMPDGREKFTFAEFAESFDLARISAVGPVFDVDKLGWLSGRYVSELSDQEFLHRASPFLPDGVTTEKLGWVATSLKARTRRFDELPGELEWITDDTPPSLAMLTAKGLPAEEVGTVLSMVADILDKIPVFEPGPIESALEKFREDHDLARRRMFMTLRVAVAGRPVSPPLHETIATLGREQTSRRLRRAAAIAVG